MPFISPQLIELAARRHGALTRLELIEDGLSNNVIRRFVADGTLCRLHDGVYRSPLAPLTFELRCAAACLADPYVTVTGRAAARLWCFRHVPNVDHPILTAAHDRTPLSNGVVVRRTNRLLPEDIVHRDDAIRVTSPPRAWFDCARDLGDEPFEMLTEWVIDEHASVPTLWRTVRRLDQRGRPGLGLVKRVLSQRPAWQKPAGSGLEHRFLAALERAGLPVLVRQHPIVLRDGSVVHPDGALPDVKWAVEIDHVTWHGGRLDAQYDKSRDRKLRRIGWQVERVTDADLRDDQAGTVAEIVELYHLRIAQLNAPR